MATTGNILPSGLPTPDQKTSPSTGSLAERAYFIWLARSRSLNPAEQDWLQAEIEHTAKVTAKADVAVLEQQITELVLRGQESDGRIDTDRVERNMAREIQQGFLPKDMLRLSGFEFAGGTTACELVGGDFFDFIPFAQGGRECLNIVVADACGHGIHSALLSAEVRGYLRGLSNGCNDIAVLFKLANRLLRGEAVSSHFVTAFLIQLDAGGRSLSYIGAGHPPGHVIDIRGNTRAVLRSSGTPLSFNQMNTFQSSRVAIEPGDLVLLNTDGITEAASPDDKSFGTERMLRCVEQHHCKNPDEILTSLFDEVTNYCQGDFRDDMTAVVIKVDGAVIL